MGAAYRSCCDSQLAYLVELRRRWAARVGWGVSRQRGMIGLGAFDLGANSGVA